MIENYHNQGGNIMKTAKTIFLALLSSFCMPFTIPFSIPFVIILSISSKNNDEKVEIFITIITLGSHK